MEFLLKALGLALITWVVGWTIVESLATWGASKSRPGTTSGTDTAIGNPAVVCKSFSQDDKGEIRGRVRFEGEDWKAVFAGDPEKPPAEGDRVTVVEVDAGHLEVRVK